MKSKIKTVLWTVPGLTDGAGESKTIRQAEAAIAAVRARVGHLPASITILWQSGQWESTIIR